MDGPIRGRRRRAPLPQQAQLRFWNRELGNATIQADNKLRKYQHGGFVAISGEVDVDLRVIFCLVARSARSTSHNELHPIPARSALIVSMADGKQYECIWFWRES
jgi:hypothetical protein